MRTLPSSACDFQSHLGHQCPADSWRKTEDRRQHGAFWRPARPRRDVLCVLPRSVGWNTVWEPARSKEASRGWFNRQITRRCDPSSLRGFPLLSCHLFIYFLNESGNIYFRFSLVWGFWGVFCFLFFFFWPPRQYVGIPGQGIEPIPHSSNQSHRGENTGASTQ